MSGFAQLRVLVVEDNHHMRALLRTVLNTLGVREVLEAGDGAAALSVLCESRCDLILSDLEMSPMDGIDFTRHLRGSHADANALIPIVMITGHTEKHRVEAARDAGVTEFIAKPVTAQTLVTRLTEIIERPRDFVRTNSYFGPDRRRRAQEDYAGPWRRHDDLADLVIRKDLPDPA